MALLNDWRVLAVGAAILWGFWGYFAKVASAHLDWRTQVLFVVATHCLLIVCVTVWQANFTLSRSHAWAVAAGVCSGVGAIFMYRALKRADAGLVIAVSSQYVLVAALLSWALLGEPMGPRKIAGLVLAAAAIVLLTWENPQASTAQASQPVADPVSDARAEVVPSSANDLGRP